MDFLRHKFLEWIESKRVAIGNTFRPFQSVELSLQRLLPSRAFVRFTQRIKFNQQFYSISNDTVYRIDPLTTMALRRKEPILAIAVNLHYSIGFLHIAKENKGDRFILGGGILMYLSSISATTLVTITKMRRLLVLLIIVIMWSCRTTMKTTSLQNKIQTPLLDRQTFLLTDISTDKTYGFDKKNPIEVGGVDKQEGPINERRFLNALAGPNGENVSYFRSGSCCPIKSQSDPFGFGSVMLDNYRVTREGAQDTVSIYINMYDYGELKAPVGFTIKNRK